MARELQSSSATQISTGRMRQKKMNVLTKLVVRLTESRRSQAGQTMTEYVLIIAAIAVAGYIAYQGLEVGINGLISKVTGSLSAA